jgi:hypothetical protein
MAEELTLQIEAKARWWFRPLFSVAMGLGRAGLLSGRAAEKLALWLGAHGVRFRVIE